MGRPRKIRPEEKTLAAAVFAAAIVKETPAPADVPNAPAQAAVFAALSTPQEPNDLELALAQAAMLEETPADAGLDKELALADVPDALSDVGPGLAVAEYDELVTIHNRMQCQYHLLHVTIPSGESREVSANFLRTVIHRREIAFLFENGDLEATQ